MKKLLAVGIIVVLWASLFTGLAPSSVALGDDWVINGDTVEREDANVYMGTTPYNISSGGYVYFDFIPKTFTGDTDFVWGFNIPTVKPTKAELYSPHWNNWTTNHEQIFYNVSSFSPSDDFCFYGNSYNTHHYTITHQACSHWNVTTGECDEYESISSVVCFDSQTNDGTNYTAYWHTNHSKLILWKGISSSFTKINYDYGGMNTWYYVKNVPVVAGNSYQVRAWVDVPISIDGVSGKYWWAVKPSSETISEAISSGHFYALDPWYSASWSDRKQWTVTNVNATTLTNFPAYINVSDEPEMQADWDDVVFTDSDSNLIAFELENYTASYADYWVNVTIPASSSVTGWMYYGNDGASSQENPEGVYDSDTKMVHHMRDLVDSTNNDNDATNHGATYTDSGMVDGAYDFNGSSDYWDCGVWNVTGAITVSTWANISTPIYVGAGLATKENSFALEADHEIFGAAKGVGFYIHSGGTWYATPTLSPEPSAGWHYLVGVFDGTNLKFYIDGEEGATTVPGVSTISSSGSNVEIGKFTAMHYFDGTVDNVVISAAARSADWINQSYELIVNQSTWVTWGSAEQYPPIPVITGDTTYNFGVNFTFTEGSGYPLDTNSYNISWSNNAASGWQNSTTNLYFNHTTQAHGYLDVDIWAYNTTEGQLSEIAASDNVTVPNNAPVITDTPDWQGDEGELVYLDFNYTDADGDTCTFSTNATKGELNTTTGVFEWQTLMSSQGTYFWNFTVNDGWGGTDYYVANITVNDLYHPNITSWWNNYTADNSSNFTIPREDADNRTVFFNVSANQSIDYWMWYVDGTLYQNSSSNNITKTWDFGGNKTVSVYGVNANGQTPTLTWDVEIEYTSHEYEKLIYGQNQLLLEENEMIAQTWIFLILLLINFALIFFVFKDTHDIFYGDSDVSISTIVISFLAVILSFILARRALIYPIEMPELNYFLLAIALVMVVLLARFVIQIVINTFYAMKAKSY